MEDLKNLQKIDPLKRIVERQTEQEEFSPMDPPDAYTPPGGETIAYEKMHPFLQSLMDDHKACNEQLDKFEKAIIAIQENGITKEIDTTIREPCCDKHMVERTGTEMRGEKL